jgi:hypothetical protein
MRSRQRRRRTSRFGARERRENFCFNRLQRAAIWQRRAERPQSRWGLIAMTDIYASASLSVIERTLVRLELPRLGWRGRRRAGLLGLLARTLRLLQADRQDVEDFEMQTQCQTQWCWAAVAASISELSMQNANRKRQCEIANDQLQAKHGDCCAASCGTDDAPFNLPGFLSRALDFVNCQRQMFETRQDLAKIQGEIRNKNPVCVRIQWNGGHEHFVVISGFGPGNYVVVRDPALGEDDASTIEYDRFPDAYRSGASLLNTYFTTRG